MKAAYLTLKVIVCLTLILANSALADPLPSWNNGNTKERIINFVEAVTDPAGQHFVPPSHRIATFDNDGNLWAEQPVYFQLLFAMDYLAERAKADPMNSSAPNWQWMGKAELSWI